ncbi:hypothetical protein Tco_0639954 [Tanacetum coccineum]
MELIIENPASKGEEKLKEWKYLPTPDLIGFMQGNNDYLEEVGELGGLKLSHLQDKYENIQLLCGSTGDPLLEEAIDGGDTDGGLGVGNV